MAMNTFLDVTGLSLYGKRVLVVGYGPVGRGAADAARGFGAVVEVCDIRADARLAAAHLGFATTVLEEGLARADVVFTATGRDGAVPRAPSPAARAALSWPTSATRTGSCPSPN
jgi:adenosylhomocysteinase